MANCGYKYNLDECIYTQADIYHMNLHMRNNPNLDVVLLSDQKKEDVVSHAVARWDGYVDKFGVRIM